MRRMLTAVLALLPALWAPLLAVAAEFHVAPGGDDAAPGSADRPFATLERARDAAREARRRAPGEPMTIWLQAGRYDRQAPFELDRRDSGTAEAPLLIAARPGAKVVLSGMTTLPREAFRPVTEAEVLDRVIDPAARARLLQVDLRALGITEFGALIRRGHQIEAGRATLAPVYLHVDGARLPLARWPNPDEHFPDQLSRFNRPRKGVVARSRILDPGPILSDGEAFRSRGGTFEVPFDRLRHWTRAKDIWLDGIFGESWEWSYNRVARLDPAQRRITLAMGELHGLRAAWSGNFFFAENLLEEIDRPGEWFLDRETGRLYLLPTEGWGGAAAQLSTLAGPMLRARDVSHLTLRGLVLEGGRHAGIVVQGGEAVEVKDSELRHFALDGVRMTGRRHGISASEIHDIGGSAVTLSCGDADRLEPGGCFVEDSRIHDWGWYNKVYTGAAILSGVGQRVVHNAIHDGPHAAIYVFGNDHLVEGNDIHHVVTTFLDMGAIYANAGSRPLDRGHVVRRNRFHDIGLTYPGQFAVYADNMSRGWRIEENLFERIGSADTAGFPRNAAIALNSANHVLIRHNLFVDTVLALRQSSHAALMLLPGLRQGWARDLPPSRLATLPQVARYPELARFWEEDPAKPDDVRFEGNAIWNPHTPRQRSGPGRSDPQVQEATIDMLGTLRREGNWVVPEGDAAPGFAETAGGGWRLRPAELRRAIRDFPEFDPREAGVRGSR